jgi:4'-phosphopantetheinyl transferase
MQNEGEAHRTMIDTERPADAPKPPALIPLMGGPVRAFAPVDCRWPFPPSHLSLGTDEVHVWCAALDGMVRKLIPLAETLSASERTRAERFQFDRDRDRFIARRGLLRAVLGQYLRVDPAQIEFSYEDRGKPSPAGNVGSEPIHFSLSHSDGVALFAFTRSRPLGIDVERVRPIAEMGQVTAKFFSARENAMLNTLPAEQRIEAFFNCWTRKEAYLKATGEGIAYALPQIEVTLAPGQPAQLLSVNGDSHAARFWFLHSLAPALGFVGALACLESTTTRPQMVPDRLTYLWKLDGVTSNVHSPCA